MLATAMSPTCAYLLVEADLQVRLHGYQTLPSLAESTACVTDDELVLLARQGDPDAFDQLVIRHQSAVYRAALAAMRVPQDAEDVAQDAFVRAWRSLGRFRRESSF